MRVIFLGTSQFAVPSLERLAAAGHAIALVVTQPDRPQGRGLRAEPSPVKAAALKLGLPLAQPERLERRPFDIGTPDVGVLAAYGEMVPRELLAWPRHGMFGVHPSLLPKHRGAAPVARALLQGDAVTGVTIFRMNDRMDAGEIALQESTPIGAEENAETLTARLAAAGAEAVVRVLGELEAGRLRLAPQDDAKATVAPKLAKAEGRIDWTAPAASVARLVRATVPWPGAATTWRATPLRIWSARASDAPAARGQPPGAVASVSDGRLLVATGQGLLELVEVQPAGKRRMTGKEFLAGYRAAPGDRLGT
jgi:methionyl-tRNA formyltransferase